jgi:hypothetical protein
MFTVRPAFPQVVVTTKRSLTENRFDLDFLLAPSAVTVGNAIHGFNVFLAER